MQRYIPFKKFKTVVFVIIIMLIAIQLMSLYNKPRLIISYDKNQWQGKDLEALSILNRHVKSALGEVCDPLPCWLRMDVIDISKINRSRPITGNDGYVYIIEKEKKTLGRIGDTCPAGSFLIEVNVKRQWWSIGKCFLNGANITFCMVP